MYTFLALSLFFLQTTVQSPSKTASKQTQEKEMQTIGQMMDSSRSVMLIDPKERADDYLKAFQFLSQEKSTSKVFFELADGSKISNVIDMKPMPNNTLIVFRYTTPQGIKFQVVEIEDILGIMHQ